MSDDAHPHVGYNADQIEHELRQVGENFATLNAAASLLEELKKTILARLARQAPDSLKSEASRMSWALAHEEYEDHLIKMVDAREAADKAKVRYVSYDVWVGLKRTQAANERTMMNIR